MNKPMPFEFLLDYLPAGVIVLPAIGMFYLYANGKNADLPQDGQKSPA